MKLVVPDGVSSLSHDGHEVEIIDGIIEVTGEAFEIFHNAHGFKTVEEVEADDVAAGKAAAIAAAVVAVGKRK